MQRLLSHPLRSVELWRAGALQNDVLALAAPKLQQMVIAELTGTEMHFECWAKWFAWARGCGVWIYAIMGSTTFAKAFGTTGGIRFHRNLLRTLDVAHFGSLSDLEALLLTNDADRASVLRGLIMTHFELYKDLLHLLLLFVMEEGAPVQSALHMVPDGFTLRHQNEFLRQLTSAWDLVERLSIRQSMESVEDLWIEHCRRRANSDFANVLEWWSPPDSSCWYWEVDLIRACAESKLVLTRDPAVPNHRCFIFPARAFYSTIDVWFRHALDPSDPIRVLLLFDRVNNGVGVPPIQLRRSDGTVTLPCFRDMSEDIRLHLRCRMGVQF